MLRWDKRTSDWSNCKYNQIENQTKLKIELNVIKKLHLRWTRNCYSVVVVIVIIIFNPWNIPKVCQKLLLLLSWFDLLCLFEVEVRWSGYLRSSRECFSTLTAKCSACLLTLWLILCQSTMRIWLTGYTSVWLVCSLRLESTCLRPSRPRYRRLLMSSGNSALILYVFVFYIFYIM